MGRQEDRRASRRVLPYRCEVDGRACGLFMCARATVKTRVLLLFARKDRRPSRHPARDAHAVRRLTGVARHGQLQNSTVADARHLLRTTMKDVDGKQEELRELVSVRYRDFIDAADTISAMGNSARTIIGAAEHAACNPASNHRGEGGQGGCSNGTGCGARVRRAGRDSPCTDARARTFMTEQPCSAEKQPVLAARSD